MAELGLLAKLAIGIVGTLAMVLWFVLLFAVFGIKGLLNELINEQRKTNDQLKAFYVASRLQSGGERSGRYLDDVDDLEADP